MCPLPSCRVSHNSDAFGSNFQLMLWQFWAVNLMFACSSTSRSMVSWMRPEDGFWRLHADYLVWVSEYTLLTLAPSCSTSKTFLKVVNNLHHLVSYLDLTDFVLWSASMWMTCWVVALRVQRCIRPKRLSSNKPSTSENGKQMPSWNTVELLWKRLQLVAGLFTTTPS